MFGAPALEARLALRGLRRQRVDHTVVHGEWLVPPDPRPGLLLYVHGGGYVSCSPETHRPVTTALARLTGRRTFVVDYRVAPEARFPAALDDVVAAYAWLVRQDGDATRGLRPGGRSRVAVVGDSAGGGLALALAQHARDRGLPVPACLVLLSPWTDLTGELPSVRGNDGKCAMFRPENIPAFAAAYLGSASARDPRASPLHGGLGGLPPTLVQVASTELLLDDARLVDEGIRAAGGESRLEAWDGVFHDWQLLSGHLPEADAAIAAIAGFVDERLGGT